MQQAEYILTHILNQNSIILKSLEDAARESTVVKTFDGLTFDAKPLRHLDALKKTSLPPKVQIPKAYDIANLRKVLKPSIQLSKRQKNIISSCFAREMSLVNPEVTEIVKNPRLPYLTLQDRRILSSDIIVLKGLKNYIKLRTNVRNPKSFYLSGPQLMDQILEGKFRYLTRDLMNDLKTTTSLKDYNNSLDFKAPDGAYSLDAIEEEIDFPTRSHHSETTKARSRNVRDMAVQTEDQYVAPVVAAANSTNRESVDSSKQNKKKINRVTPIIEEQKEGVSAQRETSNNLAFTPKIGNDETKSPRGYDTQKAHNIVESKSSVDLLRDFQLRNSSDKDGNISKSGSSRDHLIHDSSQSSRILVSPIIKFQPITNQPDQSIPMKSEEVKVHPTQVKNSLNHSPQHKLNGDHQEAREQENPWKPKINYSPNDDTKATKGRGILDLFKPKKKQVETKDTSAQDQLTEELKLNLGPEDKTSEIDDGDLVLKEFKKALDAVHIDRNHKKPVLLQRQQTGMDNRSDVSELYAQRSDMNNSPSIFTRMDSQLDNSAIDLLPYHLNNKTSEEQWSNMYPISKEEISHDKNDISWKLDSRTRGQTYSIARDEVVPTLRPGVDSMGTVLSKKTWSMAPLGDMSKADSKQERNRDLHRNFVDGLKRRRRLDTKLNDIIKE